MLPGSINGMSSIMLSILVPVERRTEILSG